MPLVRSRYRHHPVRRRRSLLPCRDFRLRAGMAQSSRRLLGQAGQDLRVRADDHQRRYCPYPGRSRRLGLCAAASAEADGLARSARRAARAGWPRFWGREPISYDADRVHAKADRTGRDFRRSGRDRHRKHAAAQRAAPTHRRSERGAGAADRDFGGAEGHLQLARRA